MICPNCGADVPASKYCPECGKKLEGAPAAAAPYAPPENSEDSTGLPESSDTAAESGEPLRGHAVDLSKAGSGAEHDIMNGDGSQTDAAAYAPAQVPEINTEPDHPSEDDAGAAQDGVSIGDTIEYKAFTSSDMLRRMPAADTAGSYETSDSVAEEDAAVPASAQESDTVPDKEPAPTDTPAESTRETRVSKQKRSRRTVPLTIAVICLCVAAVAAVCVWQWSANSPRARLTQALKDGDIIGACQIYDTELREEGLTSSEVHYLCAAAEKIADDFDNDSTGASYEGRLRLLDELGRLPYKTVQDSVNTARARVQSRSVVVSHTLKADQAEKRGDYLAAIEELEAALAESPGDGAIKSDIERLTAAYRDHALELAGDYVDGGNIAQARMVLLEAMLPERFSADTALRTRLDEITGRQLGLEESGDAARNALDMSRLGQAAFLMQHTDSLKSSTSRLTEQNLMALLLSLYEWRNYNSSPVAGSEPVLSVVRNALPVSTGSAQWPYRVSADKIQILCDALFGERAESISIADTLGTKLYGSYKYEDGWYYFASMTTPSCAVSYADPAALPHLDNNDYTFYSGSDKRADDRLYTMGIRPTITSPFGFTVSSVTTVASGAEARAEAEKILSRIPGIPASQEPSSSPSASPAPAAETQPSSAETPQGSDAAAAPDSAYAPDGSLTGGLIFPDSDMRYLSEADLAAAAATYSDLSGALQLARNEIYARRGHIFSDPQYQNYFMQYAWYSPSHQVSDSELNDYELKNLQQIASWQSGS